MSVLAVGVESSPVSVAPLVGAGDGQFAGRFVKTEAVAVGDFDVLIEGLFIVGLLEHDLALARRAAGDDHDKSGWVELNVVYEAVRRGAVSERVRLFTRFKVKQ